MELADDSDPLGTFRFEHAREYIRNYSSQFVLSPTTIRQGVVVFAGLATVDGEPVQGVQIGDRLLLNDTSAVDSGAFDSFVASMVAPLGTTDTPYAIDFLRTDVFTPDTFRNGAFRVVFLITGGYNTDETDETNPALQAETENAINRLREEDGVIVVTISGSETDPAFPNWLAPPVSDQRFHVDTFDQLPTLLDICIEDVTHRPTASPTVTCIPGTVTCCVRSLDSIPNRMNTGH